VNLNLPKWMTPWRKATDLNSVTPIREPFSITTAMGTIFESFGGAWQQNLVMDSDENMLRYAAVYACISLRARDIAKLRLMLMKRAEDGVCDEVEDASPFLSVLRKPNRFQTRIQFINCWMAAKLCHGNAYSLKERDQRGIVRALYPLDPRRTTPLIAPDSSVYYRLNADRLAGIQDAIVVPASEIIHDRCIPLWHPLVGVPPLYAAAIAATRGLRIQSNSRKFFENLSRPGGHLTAPGTINETTAARLKQEFEKGFAGNNIGRLFVSGDGLKFEPFTIPADQAQLIEQQKWTVEDIARAFGVPLYKIQAGDIPSTDNVGALNQQYLDQTLQEDIESIELLLDEGLELPNAMHTEIDSDGLMRMDPLGRSEVYDKQVKAGVMSPNEARRKEGRHGVAGGETPYLQQQNFSLAALAKRDASDDPFGTKPKPAPAPAAANDPNMEGAANAAKTLKAKFEAELTKKSLEAA
jgi:HK97 family phage portal protein